MMINNLPPTRCSTGDEFEFETPEIIRKSDLEQVLASHSRSSVFKQTLGRIATGEDLLSTLSRYIYFNSIFGSGVANLAGEIGSRQRLFSDPDEQMEIEADRSVEVAARISLPPLTSLTAARAGAAHTALWLRPHLKSSDVFSAMK